MFRRIVAIALLAATAACGAGGRPDVNRPASSDASASERFPDDALERALMQSGTNWVDGALVSFCRGGDCEEVPSPQPSGSLRTTADGVVLFIVGAPPTAGHVAIRKEGRGVMRRALRPSTIMPLQTALRPGRYQVTLTAEWGSRAARWSFRLSVD